MTILQLINKCRQLIAKGELPLALQLLQEKLSNHPLENDVMLLYAQWNSLRKDIKMGLIPSESKERRQNNITHQILELCSELYQSEKDSTTIFISHDHSITSLDLATNIKQVLQEQKFNVFVDKADLIVGTHRNATIDKSILESNFFVLLLSEESNHNEVTFSQVHTAYQSFLDTGSPVIIPIRVQFPIEKKLSPTLHNKLADIVPFNWESKQHTSLLCSQLLAIFSGEVFLTIAPSNNVQDSSTDNENTIAPPSPSLPLESPQGSVRIDSPYYITRKNEEDIIEHLNKPAALIRIRAPQQFGKTSLLHRLIDYAVKQEFSVIPIDFHEFTQDTLSDLTKLLYKFCLAFATNFSLESEFKEEWEEDEDKIQAATYFIEQEILRVQSKPILLAIDKADRLFEYRDVSENFFLLIRAWHQKGTNPAKSHIWKKLRLVLSYSTDAHLAISNPNASPFNVGVERSLKPFTKEEVKHLLNIHQLSWSADHLDEMMNLLGGQPYLVRKALYLLKNESYSIDSLTAKAAQMAGPFSDHLRHHLYNIQDNEQVKTELKNILYEGKCKNAIIAGLLESAGLITGLHPTYKMTNELYAKFFKQVL